MEFIAPSGAKVVIAIAPWADAKTLKKRIESEAAHSGIALDVSADITSLLGTFLKVDSSDAVDAALWPCLARCTRNGEKIVESTFDDADARKDYYPIVKACVEENLRPLAEPLIALFKAAEAKKKAAAPQSA